MANLKGIIAVAALASCLSTPAMALNNMHEQAPQAPQGQQCQQGKQGKQGKAPKFDPAKYQKELEAFITKEAKLTSQEAAKFFPIYREMQKKQRALFGGNRKKFDKSTFTNNAAAAKAVREQDKREIEIKKLQQQYHERFLKILPATKVLIITHAEERFNRNMMRNMAGGPGGPGGPGEPKDGKPGDKPQGNKPPQKK